MGEFVDGVFRAEVRDELLAIVDRLVREHGVEGVILGGTELPLALGDQRGGTVPFLDTTRIHVQAAVARMLS
jgi:aspartate racemase